MGKSKELATLTDAASVNIDGAVSISNRLVVDHSSNSYSAFPSGNWAAKIYNHHDTYDEGGLVVANRYQAATSTPFLVGNLFDNGDGFDTYLKVDGVGRVTMPYQPAFVAVRNATFFYTPASGYSVINNWGTGKNSFNTGSHFNSSTGQFTAPISGVYTFKFQILLSDLASGEDGIHVAFYQNGTNLHFSNIRAPGSSANSVVGYGGYLPVVGVLDTYCSANDTIDIRLSSSGNIQVYSGSDWGRFSGYLIG